ncbi:MAG: hypothetical protein ACR2MO_04350 [Acidimicrobiales bacterium]
MARATRAHAVETRSDRAVLAQHAGLGRASLVSVLAGTLVAYGAFAVLLAITAAVAESVGFDTNLSTTEWRGLGAVGGAVVAAVLLVCYLFGGYVAGRMARRAGATNGFLVFVLGVVVAGGVAGLVNVFTDGDEILRNLRNVGIPTSGEEWRDVGTVAGIGSLLAMLVGSVLGGALGERWHTKLLALAADPSVGPEAEARAAAEHHRRELRRAEERARESRLEPVDTEPRTVAAPGIGEDDRAVVPSTADRPATLDDDQPKSARSAR